MIGLRPGPVLFSQWWQHLMWVHDIPHISHQAQRLLFALVLTSLPSHALAVTLLWLSGLVPYTNSLTKFTSSPPTHASSCIYIFLFLMLSPVLSCFILPYPSNLMSLLSLPTSLPSTLPHFPLSLSLFSFLPLFPLLWRSAMKQSQIGHLCLITLIKQPVR